MQDKQQRSSGTATRATLLPWVRESSCGVVSQGQGGGKDKGGRMSKPTDDKTLSQTKADRNTGMLRESVPPRTTRPPPYDGHGQQRWRWKRWTAAGGSCRGRWPWLLPGEGKRFSGRHQAGFFPPEVTSSGQPHAHKEIGLRGRKKGGTVQAKPDSNQTKPNPSLLRSASTCSRTRPWHASHLRPVVPSPHRPEPRRLVAVWGQKTKNKKRWLRGP